MPPPPGYLRFSDVCDELCLSANTVKKTMRRLKAEGTPVEPIPSGTMKLFTPEQVRAIRRGWATSTVDATH